MNLFQTTRDTAPAQVFHWRCNCNRRGTINTAETNLGILLQLARADHDQRFGNRCKTVDITDIDTSAEHHYKETHPRVWQRSIPPNHGGAR